MTAEPPRCPFCASTEIEVVSAWGGQLITRLVRCRRCNTHFEAVRDDFTAPDGGAAPAGDVDPSG